MRPRHPHVHSPRAALRCAAADATRCACSSRCGRTARARLRSARSRASWPRKPAGARRAAENLHLTLAFVGDVAGELRRDVARDRRGGRGVVPPFTLDARPDRDLSRTGIAWAGPSAPPAQLTRLARSSGRRACRRTDSRSSGALPSARDAGATMPQADATLAPAAPIVWNVARLTLECVANRRAAGRVIARSTAGRSWRPRVLALTAVQRAATAGGDRAGQPGRDDGDHGRKVAAGRHRGLEGRPVAGTVAANMRRSRARRRSPDRPPGTTRTRNPASRSCTRRSSGCGAGDVLRRRFHLDDWIRR